MDAGGLNRYSRYTADASPRLTHNVANIQLVAVSHRSLFVLGLLTVLFVLRPI